VRIRYGLSGAGRWGTHGPPVSRSANGHGGDREMIHYSDADGPVPTQETMPMSQSVVDRAMQPGRLPDSTSRRFACRRGLRHHHNFHLDGAVRNGELEVQMSSMDRRGSIGTHGKVVS
jgi:hypothetical protein